MQARYSYERNVCSSVKRVNCDNTKETYAHILIPQKDRYNSFATRKMVGESCPFVRKILDKSDRPSKTAISNPYTFAAVVTESEKKFNYD